MENKIITITEEMAGTRMDKIVSKTCDLSRTRVKELLEQEKIHVNDQLEKGSYTCKVNDTITVEIPDNQPLDVKPEKMDLDIIYEDHDVLVINKPKGMVVHPAPGHLEHTLVNGLLYHCDDLSGINGVLRPGIVHRIDKDTSGLLVVAKNDNAHMALSSQLADKTCHREYVAIVHHPFNHSYGTIDAPIGRDPQDRQKMAVTEKNSKPAITHFQVLQNFKDYAYIRCQLETGRTHQIRVHMAYIGHPIAGDPKYGYRKTIAANGQLLHACALEFIHPTTHEHMHFEAPLDPTFEKILKQLETEG